MEVFRAGKVMMQYEKMLKIELSSVVVQRHRQYEQ